MGGEGVDKGLLLVGWAGQQILAAMWVGHEEV